MNNGKSGVTIVALGIIIVLMGMFILFTNISISDLIDDTFIKEYASELQQLEYLSNDYLIRNNGKIDFEQYEINTTSISSEFLEQLSEETVVDNVITLYILDLDKIDAMDTNYGNQKDGIEDIYLISEETGSVYYKLGVKYNDVTYYTLTNELKDILEN